MISWLSSGGGWGTREQAIPGEWAALVLIMVLGALLGLLVLWFTVLRHERTIRRRAARRPDGMNDTHDTNGTIDVVALAGIGAAADERATTGPELESAAEADHEVDVVDEAVEEVEEPAVREDDDEAGEAAAEPSAASSSQAAAGSAQRKLTDEILSRVETELAGRETPRWKELAELVRREFDVTVHPSSIQKAVKRRRLAAAQSMSGVTAVTSAPDVQDVPDTTDHAAEPHPVAPDPRPESAGDVRPNGGRRSTAWASPAYPAADAG